MLLVTTFDDLKSIPWNSVFRCVEEFRSNNPAEDLYEYMKQTWGLEHGHEDIKIVDEKKYTMFLLRWA